MTRWFGWIGRLFARLRKPEAPPPMAAPADVDVVTAFIVRHNIHHVGLADIHRIALLARQYSRLAPTERTDLLRVFDALVREISRFDLRRPGLPDVVAYELADELVMLMPPNEVKRD